MAKGHKPKAGSRGFWPRKRAKRIYPRIKTWPKVEETKPLGFAGYKAGMLQVVLIDNRKNSPTQGQEIVEPVTVLDCPELFVYGIRVYKKDISGLKTFKTVFAEKLSKDLERKTKIPKNPKTKENLEEIEKKIEEMDDVRLLVHTQPRNSGLRKKKPEIFEIALGGKLKEKWDYAKEKLGKTLSVEEIFKEGEYVDVKAVTTGKGTQGPVKRFGIKIQSRKAKEKRRHVGTLGDRRHARVIPGKVPMAGQMGFQTRTEYNKKVLAIGNNGLTPKGGWLRYGIVPGKYILIHGSVPGPKKRLILFRKAIRPPKVKTGIPEIKEILIKK